MVIDAPFGEWDLTALVLLLLPLLLFWVVALYLPGIIYYCRRALRVLLLTTTATVLRLRGIIPPFYLFLLCSVWLRCMHEEVQHDAGWVWRVVNQRAT